jgi:hypothetical protein
MDQISEVQFSAEPETLMALSRLFAYPKQRPDDRDLARIFSTGSSHGMKRDSMVPWPGRASPFSDFSIRHLT